MDRQAYKDPQLEYGAASYFSIPIKSPKVRPVLVGIDLAAIRTSAVSNQRQLRSGFPM